MRKTSTILVTILFLSTHCSCREEVSLLFNCQIIHPNEMHLDKVFQPFFTTKPTGQGTGLGLSLAYDIIKSHGGELNVGTKCVGDSMQAGAFAEAGTEFRIELPVNKN